MGNTVMKGNARKVRRLYRERVLAGFAGGTADAFTLFERFEEKLDKHQGNLLRSAVELAKDWRTDRLLRRLEALLAVADTQNSLIISGTGDVIEPEDAIMAIGSGGGTEWAVAAGVALGYAVGGSEGPKLTGLAAQARREALARMMTVPLREQVTWFTAENQASGKIMPVRDFTDEQGRTCRDFVEWRTVRATNGHTSGTACL